MAYEQMKERFAASPFRSRFKLTRTERAYLAQKGWDAVRSQTERIIRERLAPAAPRKDGSQTPMRGHPVFIAQHATATCCRGCLAKWHGIPPGHPLSEAEIAYATAMILDWLRDHAGDLLEFPHTPDLFRWPE
ncbi:MAG: DUF4186 domain-containing protein [Lentisphaeria bacterium]|nr:DUF4186 domain-containing protein [Lentisphaeria bacterium]